MFFKRPSIKVNELVQKVYPGEKLNPNLLAFFENRRLNDVTPLVIESFKETRLKTVSPASVNRDLSILRHAFSMAVTWELIPKNPVKGIQFLKEKSRVRVMSYEEEAKLLEVSPPWLKDCILIALNTGLRAGEIITLLWEDIDLNHQSLTVKESLKNNLPRSIPMNETVYELFKVKYKGQSPYDLVFPGRKVYDISHYFHRACLDVGLKDLRFHDTRHTFSSRLSMAGCNVFQIQTLLGHKSLFMSWKYSHHSLDNLRGVVGQLTKGE